MKITQKHFIYIFVWAITSVYLVGFKDQIESVLPLVNVTLISAVALQVWFMSLFEKKRYYIISILAIQLVLSGLQTYSPENALVKSVLDGMDLGSMIGLLFNIGVWA